VDCARAYIKSREETFA